MIEAEQVEIGEIRSREYEPVVIHGRRLARIRWAEVNHVGYLLIRILRVLLCIVNIVIYYGMRVDTWNRVTNKMPSNIL